MSTTKNGKPIFSSPLAAGVARLLAAGAVSLVALAGGCGDPEPSGQPPADLASFVVVQDFSKVYVCVSSCTTNQQCQDSCPVPTSGTSCCDTSTKQCFTSQTNMCPAPPDLAVSSPY